MKVVTILAISAALSLAVVATASAAVTQTFGDVGTDTVGTPSIGVKPSKNVVVGYWRGQTGTPAVNIGYSCNAYHKSGDKTFSSSSGDTKIFWYNGTNQDAPAAPTAAGASAAFGNGWTSL